MLEILSTASNQGSPITLDLVMAICSVVSVLLALGSELRRRRATSERNDASMVKVAFDGMDNLTENLRRERTELLLEIGSTRLYIAELTSYILSHGLALPQQPEPLSLSDLYKKEDLDDDSPKR